MPIVHRREGPHGTLPTQRVAAAGGKETRGSGTCTAWMCELFAADAEGGAGCTDRSRADAGDRRLASGGADASDGLAAKGSEDVFPRVNACEGSQDRSRFAQHRVDGR